MRFFGIRTKICDETKNVNPSKFLRDSYNINDLSEKSYPNDNDTFRGMTSNHLSQKMHIRFSLNDFGARGFLIEMSKNF